MHGVITTPSPDKPIVRRINDWSLREHEVVVSHWPNLLEIRRLLPHRTVNAINSFAGKCNLRKELHVWTTTETALLKRRVREGRTRAEVAAELGMTTLQVQNRCQYLKLSHERRPPKPTGDRLMDAVYQRAFELNMSRRELDEACSSGGQFQRWSPARKIAFKHVLKAVRLMEGQLAVEWSDAHE